MVTEEEMLTGAFHTGIQEMRKGMSGPRHRVVAIYQIIRTCGTIPLATELAIRTKENHVGDMHGAYSTVPLGSAPICTPSLGKEDPSPKIRNQIRFRRYGVRDPAPKVIHIYVNGPDRHIPRFLCWLCLEIATLQIMF